MSVTWAHTNLTWLRERTTGPQKEIPPTCVHSAFLLETLLQARHWARHKGHRHHHVSLLVPEELVLPHAVLRALYVVTSLILGKAPEGTLTLPILQMGKLSPRAVEVTCPRLQGWSVAELLCLHVSSTGL